MKLARYKKTFWWVAGIGAAAGLGVVFVWPIIKKRLIAGTVSVPVNEIRTSGGGYRLTPTA